MADTHRNPGHMKDHDAHAALIRCLEAGDPESARVYWRNLVKHGGERKARRLLVAATKLAGEVLT